MQGSRWRGRAPTIAAVLFGSGWLTGCANVDEVRSGEKSEGFDGTAAAAAPGLELASAFEAQDTAGGVLTAFGAQATDPSEPATPDEASPTKRLMVYEGRFTVLVANVRDAVVKFVAAVEERGGYLQSRTQARVVCRVPAEHFQEIVDSLPEFGMLLDESIEARDVTKRYFDLEIRIRNAEQSLARLNALLAQAEKVEDLLKIEQEIRRLTEELERLKGERRFLSQQIALSKLEVEFRSNAPEPRPVRRRARSRFHWINQVGVKHVLERF